MRELGQLERSTISTRDDSLVSLEQGQSIRDHYETTGAPCKYVELDGAGHGARDETYEGQNLRQIGEAFLLEHMDLTVRE